MSKRIRTTWEAIRSHALSLPEAWEDHPWGEIAMKVRKKVFVFMWSSKDELRLSMKLPASCDEVLRRDDVDPTGYGLGRHGWVTFKMKAADIPSHDDLFDWLEESYQAVAPKKLGRLLEPDE